MTSFKLSLFVIEVGALVFAFLFFFYSFAAGWHDVSGRQKQFRECLALMSNSGLAFAAFVLVYIVMSVLRGLGYY
jgi:hypothetical protein